MTHLTSKELSFLSRILDSDCSYLENCTEEEFKTYFKLRGKLNDYD